MSLEMNCDNTPRLSSSKSSTNTFQHRNTSRLPGQHLPQQLAKQSAPRSSQPRAPQRPCRSRQEPTCNVSAKRSRVPDSDPVRTNLLWQRVLQRHETMSKNDTPRYLSQTQSSRKKTVSGRRTSGRGIAQPASPSTISDSSPSITQSTAISSVPSVSGKSKRSRLTDTNFREAVFERHGISLDHALELREPYEYFGTEEPRENMQEWYKQRHPECDVWLPANEEESRRIAEQYRNMLALKENEAKFSYRGKRYFFKDDDLHAPGDDIRCSSVYFQLEWAPNPDGQQLICPPVVAEDRGLDFGFNSNPDCTYWLTTRCFNMDYRKQINRLTFVLPNVEAAAPYLTIEFKKDVSTFDAAVNQLAVSATLILYNRFRLRLDHLRAMHSLSSVNERAYEDLKHYGIAFNGSKAHFFLAQPRLNLESPSGATWKGCRLTHFTTFDANNWQHVISIQHWLNEIHNWGLGEFSSYLMLDVKGILRAAPGGSRVSLLQGDVEDLEQWKRKIGILSC